MSQLVTAMTWHLERQATVDLTHPATSQSTVIPIIGRRKGLMHYIRLLRPPSLDRKENLKLVFTITTDLGDSFLCPEQPLPISIFGVHLRQEVPQQARNSVKLDDGSVKWCSTSRVLKLDLHLPAQILRALRSARDDNSSPRISIVTSRAGAGPPHIAEVPFDSEGLVLGLSVPLPRPGKETCFTATRDFLTSVSGATGILRIDEEIGESIDRHVWDAGVVTTGLIFDMCKTTDDSKWTKTPMLRKILGSTTSERPLNVIELGCGVGILGIGLATALSARSQSQQLPKSENNGSTVASDPTLEDTVQTTTQTPEVGSILLTDLPDAGEMTKGNIGHYYETRYARGPGNVSVQFEGLDWEDGKEGILGPKAKVKGWDLIIISDCTYNVDMLSALVDTLSALHNSAVGLAQSGPKVMLATKPRHSSEKALFDLMKASGWAILESASQPLPTVDLDEEVVEIYLFGKLTEQAKDDQESSSATAKRRKLR